MSQFLTAQYHGISPYTAGEQPHDRTYIKLNANETSCPPSSAVLQALRSCRMEQLGRYADPYSNELRTAIATHYHLSTTQVLATNGADEALTFIFQTFFLDQRICFPDITYNYYETLATAFHIDAQKIPLQEDFRLDVAALCRTDRHIVIANPNAPTGLLLSPPEIERITASKPNRLVVVDEAYIDFGNTSCLPLLQHYSNLIIVHTMSKSRNLAGAHIGCCLASPELIRDLAIVKGVLNPFNISDINQAIGTAAMKDTSYLRQCTAAIQETRSAMTQALRELDFTVLESHTNFLFITHPQLSASDFNQALRKAGILARWYDQDRIRNFLRITIGTPAEMRRVLEVTRAILLKRAA